MGLGVVGLPTDSIPVTVCIQQFLALVIVNRITSKGENSPKTLRSNASGLFLPLSM